MENIIVKTQGFVSGNIREDDEHPIELFRQTPFGRMGDPEELCGTIHYLMSDASKFVTGTVAVVDGGFNVFAM